MCASRRSCRSSATPSLRAASTRSGIARLDGGLRSKAQRGELRMHLPVGFDRDEDGQIVLCADEQVRQAIERVFALWRKLGTARQIVGELIADGQKLPRRRVGERRVRW